MIAIIHSSRERASFPNIYLEVDKLAGARKEAVCARPQIPPKDNSCIAIIYFSCWDISWLDNKVIPLLISRFPRRSNPGSDIFCNKLLQNAVRRENKTI